MVKENFTPINVGDATVYDLTAPAPDLVPAAGEIDGDFGSWRLDGVLLSVFIACEPTRRSI